MARMHGPFSRWAGCIWPHIRSIDPIDPIVTGGAPRNLHAKLGFLKSYAQPIEGLGCWQFFRLVLCGAAARFLKPHFSILFPPRKQAKPCWCILSTIDTTPSCKESFKKGQGSLEVQLSEVLSGQEGWYVSNVSIIFDAPCLFVHHLPTISLHFVALLCIFRN
jgi:hypothetical protein